MDYLLVYQFLQNHVLSIFVLVLTLFLFYYYLVDKNKIYKVSKKYKESIYQTQSKIFLNATHYLIAGDKDLAIKEFLNAVDHNKETIDTHLTLGRLFRVNGEIEKAINIHRGLLARETISESQRLESLKELGKDFDKGGFLDKATETYKEVLKLNSDQADVIKSLCRIFEDLEEWDEALKYRRYLSKVSQENQSETISHIYTEQAKNCLKKGDLNGCLEKLEQALRYFPSVSAKIIQLKFYVIAGRIEDSKALLIEMMNEHEMFLDYMFLSLDEFDHEDEKLKETYFKRLKNLKTDFLRTKVPEQDGIAIAISKFKILKEKNLLEDAYEFYKSCLKSETPVSKSEVFRIEFIKFLIETNRTEEALELTKSFIYKLERHSSLHYCSSCGYTSDVVFWRCQQCFEWETINFKYELS